MAPEPIAWAVRRHRDRSQARNGMAGGWRQGPRILRPPRPARWFSAAYRQVKRVMVGYGGLMCRDFNTARRLDRNSHRKGSVCVQSVASVPLRVEARWITAAADIFLPKPPSSASDPPHESPRRHSEAPQSPSPIRKSGRKCETCGPVELNF